ncbi:MAG: hypothetical protein JJU08_05910 [Rhodobacteraceae bacterium]|nr:hypothetical protein [Paracoccaceae bacterium]
MTARFTGAMIDGHAHFHAGYEPSRFLDAASTNFRRFATPGPDNNWLGVLMLCDMRDQNTLDGPWRDLVSSSVEGSDGEWSARLIGNPCPAVLFTHSFREPLLVIPGRQVATRERLEVLLLGIAETYPDGGTMDETLAWGVENDALTVLPWGVGKWLGRRGAIIERLLRTEHVRQCVLVGDSGIRPSAWSEPAQFKYARACGVRILPGTDPLPMAEEQTRVGSFGALLDYPIALDGDPVATLKHAIRAPGVTLKPFGRSQGNTRFLRNQVRLRLKRTG